MSAHAEKTVTIRRPVASVFDFVLNGANNRLWKPAVSDVRPLSTPPYGMGSKFEQHVQGPAGPLSADYQIVQYEHNQLIGLQVLSGPARWSGRYEFRAQQGATEVTYELAYDPSEYDPELAQQVLPDMQAVLSDEQAASARLSSHERHALLLRLDGKASSEIARLMFVGEGTVRNYLFSGLSKLMAPTIQQWMDDEVRTLDELKSFLEKIV